MEAGRELDALVAEKVMGLRLASVEEYCRWLHYAHKEVEKFKKNSCRFIGPDEFGVFNELAYYSEDIADAWAVVEKLKENAFEEFAFEYNKFDEEKPWGFTDRPALIDYYGVDIRSDSVPHLICLAALKAVRYTVE